LDTPSGNLLWKSSEPVEAAVLRFAPVCSPEHLCKANILNWVRTHQSVLRISHIFLLAAVMSLLAFVILSRRSWCSSSSALKASNMGINGDVAISVIPNASSADRLIFIVIEFAKYEWGWIADDMEVAALTEIMPYLRVVRHSSTCVFFFVFIYEGSLRISKGE
jgi:hypothetical protein